MKPHNNENNIRKQISADELYDEFKITCKGPMLNGCKHGGGAVVGHTKHDTWKGNVLVHICQQCADDIYDANVKH